MNKLFTKIATACVGLVMAVGVGVAVGSGSSKDVRQAEAASGTFTKITAAPLDWSGEYIIVYESGNTAYCWKGVDATSNYATATISSGSISGPANASTITVASMTGGYSVMVNGGTNDGKYIKNASSNGIVFQDEAAVTTFAYENNSVTMTCGGKNFRYNSASGNYRFRYFGSAQQVIQLYKAASTKTSTTTTVSAGSNSLAIGATTTLSATVTYSGGTITSPSVTYKSGDESVATVSGNTVTAVGAGTVTITGTYAGDDTYAESSGQVSITVTKNTTTGAGTVYFGSGSTKGTINVNATSVSGSDSLENDWTVVTVPGSSGESFNPQADYAQIGASSKPAESITFTQNFSSTYYVTSFQAKFGGFSGTAGTITAKVGETTIASGSLSGTSDVTINETTQTASSTSLVVTVTNISKGVKAYYISYTLSSSATVTYTVTYNGNTSTGGTAPTDSNSPYTSGATVTVLGPGNLVKTDYTFNGWNTAADGSGSGYAEDDTFTISGNTTLYAQWIQTLDAITSITGTVSASISAAGSYNWNFNNISVVGTLSGVTNKDVKSYVDLSSTTPIPSSTGSCTVSVTATRKSSVPGAATSLTNPSISGDVQAPKLTYTFTMTQADLLQTNVSYANENAHAKSSTAECADHEDIEIAWASNQVQKNSSDMQFQTTNGYIYNTTEIPGTIVSVVVTATAQSFTVFYGNAEHPTSETTPGGSYFTVQGVGSTPKASQIVVTFEVSDKPKVQLVASDLNVDVADGASTPVVTDGTSAVTGYRLTSEDPYVASITNDWKVQPVGYGRVTVSVTKPEDSGHIYLATTFTVYVGDHSKQVSKMEFSEAAEEVQGQTNTYTATADDSVEWTIVANQSQNEFSDVYGINFGVTQNKVSSLVMTTPADEERIIKNVVVEAMTATDTSTITVSVGSTPLTCNKSNTLTGNISTYNFSGNISGAITITISGTQSVKYGVKSIAVLYVGDEATSFASTFLGAISCNNQGTSKPQFNIKEGDTRWSWSLLEDAFDDLDQADKNKFAVGATGVSETITECVKRYDYIVGKYYIGGLDTTLISSDFMGRNPPAVGVSRGILPDSVAESTNTITAVVVISVISAAAVGGYFFLRRRKEI